MISGVAVVDDAGYPSGVSEIKASSETGADPQSARQGNGTATANAERDASSQTATRPFDGFGDRFSTESAQALLDAQETLPVPPPRPPAAGAADTDASSGAASEGDTSAKTDANPLDTNQDGMVSFVEWLQSQNGGSDLTARAGGTETSVNALLATASGRTSE